MCLVFADSEAFGNSNNSDSGIVLDVQEPVVHTPTMKKRQKRVKKAHRTEHGLGPQRVVTAVQASAPKATIINAGDTSVRYEV